MLERGAAAAVEGWHGSGGVLPGIPPAERSDVDPGMGDGCGNMEGTAERSAGLVGMPGKLVAGWVITATGVVDDVAGAA